MSLDKWKEEREKKKEIKKNKEHKRASDKNKGFNIDSGPSKKIVNNNFSNKPSHRISPRGS